MQIMTMRPRRMDRLVFMGAPGVGMTLTDGLKALREYEPSLEAMDALLKNYFAVDKSLITDDLVRIRYEASAAPGRTRPTERCSSIPSTPGPSSGSPRSRCAQSRPRPCSCMAAKTR